MLPFSCPFNHFGGIEAEPTGLAMKVPPPPLLVYKNQDTHSSGFTNTQQKIYFYDYAQLSSLETFTQQIISVDQTVPKQTV
jgi:hypothetical protein